MNAPAQPVQLARPAKLPDDRPVLFELHERLDAGGTAEAWRMFWDAGDYVADESVEYEVRDMQRRHWGVEGERVSCRSGRMPDDAAHVWEVVSGGAPWYGGALTEDLTFEADAEATVTIYGVARTVTVSDRFLSFGDQLDSGTSIGFVYDLQAGAFVVTEAPCG